MLRNGIKLEAGLGEQNMSASIPVQQITSTAMPPMARLCSSELAKGDLFAAVAKSVFLG